MRSKLAKNMFSDMNVCILSAKLYAVGIGLTGFQLHREIVGEILSM